MTIDFVLTFPFLCPSTDAEINGCSINPCDTNADCVDLPPPSNGANCTCKAGYSGAGTPGTCVGKQLSLRVWDGTAMSAIIYCHVLPGTAMSAPP
jgi:hypothetical protein